jgi:hypothetical protein
MNNSLINVSFNNQSITAFVNNGEPVVALKPIIENLGIDWVSQYKRIQRHPVLNSTMVMMTTVAEDGKMREMVCLPLDYLNGWLFGIDASRVNDKSRDKVIAYQRECFKVLAEHFGLNTPKPNKLNTNQARFIQRTVNALVKQTGEHYQTIYHRIKEVFDVAKYDEVTQEQFPALCDYLGVVYLSRRKTSGFSPRI